MKILAFIPARLESKRYPNKILKNIFNYPMIEHVRRRADLSGVFERTFIVTNSNYLKKKLKKYSSDIIITKKNILVELAVSQKYLENLNLIMLS